MSKENHNRDLLYRLAGLICVGLIGGVLMGCGLALAFGSYRLSMILFFIVVLLLVVFKAAARSM
jgi:hypothetical protein